MFFIRSRPRPQDFQAKWHMRLSYIVYVFTYKRNIFLKFVANVDCKLKLGENFSG